VEPSKGKKTQERGRRLINSHTVGGTKNTLGNVKAFHGVRWQRTKCPSGKESTEKKKKASEGKPVVNNRFD